MVWFGLHKRQRRMVQDGLTSKTVAPPEVVFIRDFDDFLERGQPVERALTDEQADSVTPLDLLHSDQYTTKATRDERFAVCKGCPRLFKPTRTCRECGCFMGLKTWIAEARCPLGYWEADKDGEQ